MANVVVKLELKLPATVKQDSTIGMYVSCCPILDIYSQGETIKKSLDNLQEAVSAFLVTCFEKGTLEQVLRDSGFTPIKKSTQKVTPRFHYKHSIPVSIPFIAKDTAACLA